MRTILLLMNMLALSACGDRSDQITDFEKPENQVWNDISITVVEDEVQINPKTGEPITREERIAAAECAEDPSCT